MKLSLFADVMVLYIENPEDSTKKVLELKNEFSKVKIYKVNTQISVASLYMNNNYQKEKNPTYNHIKKVLKCLEINLTKEVKNLCTENYKTLRKETEGQTNRRIFSDDGLEDIILLKCSCYTMQSKDSVQSLTKFQGHFPQK